MALPKRSFAAICLALIPLGACVGADVPWAFVESHIDDGGHPVRLSRPSGIHTQAQRSFQEYTVILDRNLFGGRGRMAAPASKATTTPTDTAPTKPRLNLKLVGTAVGDMEHTYAIIEELTTKKQDLYRLGDLVQQATILEITRNRVLIDNRGQRQTLVSFQGKPPVPQPLPQADEREHPDGEEAMRTGLPKIGDNTWLLTRDMLSEQFENLHRLLTEARLTPHLNNGQPDGFELTELVKNSFLDRIGLRNGDILKGVNGRKLKGPNDAFEAYRQLLREPIVQLEVERGGQTQRFTYEIR